MKILSCNIRCFGAQDGDNAWGHRRELCAWVIRNHSPDLVGFQEMWHEQFDDLSATLPEYDWHALTDEACNRRPMNAIFYRRDAFVRLASGGYWLSQQPHVPNTRNWNSACVRLANWIRLEERHTGKEFRFVNTHLDHVSQEARENQARLIVEDAAAYGEAYPQILTGDMNCDAGNPAIATFRRAGWRDSYAECHGQGYEGHTYHGFEGPSAAGKSTVKKMDWVFVRGAWRVTGAEIIDDHENDRYPSDHYFVGATVQLEG